MTVRESEGDSSGNSATPPPATVRKVREVGVSPELPFGGRFWALQASDEEEDGVSEEIAEVEGSESFRYLCHTLTPAGDKDISEDTTELARRARKRIERQKNQREAAMAAIELSTSTCMLSPSLMPLGMSVGKVKTKSRPVLEPSVFTDDNMDGWTVVRRRRWPPAIISDAHDPRNVENSRICNLGLDMHRAGTKLDRARWGPVVQRNHAGVQTPGAATMNRSHQARVGNQVAGRAFRRILGLAWRKVESGEPILQQWSSDDSMYGDGGQGGFSPGRGGFQAGRGGGFPARRGGYQGRGGFGVACGTNGHVVSNTMEEVVAVMVLVVAKAMGEASEIKMWNNSGRGGYQQRFRADGHVAPAPTGMDANLLHQTVEAVVATVTAAQKTTNAGGRTKVHAVAGHGVGSGGTNQPTVVPVAAATVMQQDVEVSNQEVEDAHVTGSKGKENEASGPSKKKKEDKMSCFRCKKLGHYIDDCPTPFCNLCESIHHVASACHLLQAPKPTATIHGYANEAQLPCGAFKAKVENPKLAKETKRRIIHTFLTRYRSGGTPCNLHRRATRRLCGPSLRGGPAAALVVPGSTVLTLPAGGFRHISARPVGQSSTSTTSPSTSEMVEETPVTYEDLNGELKKKYDEVKVLLEADLIGSFHRPAPMASMEGVLT
ncbi:hypothetical protein QYE76_015839 [Lolium multiflorum]|uniref:CCHC-type domain-containing protein n=1 Tax=Lolium multiflorum TaxID=4521 RepID=A0AAD8U5K8_LOLMU|nr:hypothetical protein QYE76_015839 [Lolium multiflorum]